MKVSFGMHFEVYGRQTVELPDDIDPKNKEAIIKYLKDNWDDIPLPTGDYVSGSDNLDEEGEFFVFPS